MYTGETSHMSQFLIEIDNRSLCASDNRTKHPQLEVFTWIIKAHVRLMRDSHERTLCVLDRNIRKLCDANTKPTLHTEVDADVPKETFYVETLSYATKKVEWLRLTVYVAKSTFRLLFAVLDFERAVRHDLVFEFGLTLRCLGLTAVDKKLSKFFRKLSDKRVVVKQRRRTTLVRKFAARTIVTHAVEVANDTVKTVDTVDFDAWKNNAQNASDFAAVCVYAEKTGSLPTALP